MGPRHSSRTQRSSEAPPTQSVRSVALVLCGIVIGLALPHVKSLFAADATAGDAELPSREQQLAEMKLGQVSVPLVVESIGAKGHGVFYAGSAPLPAGTVVSLYRCLLVRSDVMRAWRDEGVVSKEAWRFWRRYTVEVSGDEDGRHLWRDQWQALPVGDVGALDSPSWWRHGELSERAVGRALEAINARRLVDWRRPAHSPSLGTLLFNAHMINEPSDDAAENVEGLHGSRCAESAEEVRWCGAVLRAKTSRELQPGQELLWCYGEGYERDYRAGATCLDDASRG